MRALRLAEHDGPELSWRKPCASGVGSGDPAASLACEAGGVQVRLLAEADARQCWRLMVERAAGCSGWRSPPGLADIRRRLATLAAARGTRRGLGLAVCAKGVGSLLGWIELECDAQVERRVSLRLCLTAPAEAGMTEGALAALPAALRFLGADVLAASVAADDPPALRLVRRLGLKPTRTVTPGMLHFQRELAGIL